MADRQSNPRLDTSSPTSIAGLGLFLLSISTLAFEINLTRLFSVAQFYHFAFMIVSLALLGFGASGSVLALLPNSVLRLSEQGLSTQKSLGWLSLATGLSILGAYLLVNWLPFDSFSIAWDRRQIFTLILHYLSLALPFFFSGMAVGLLLATYPRSTGKIYSINLLGSATGCFAALIAPPYLGGEGTVTLCSGMAGLAAVICMIGTGHSSLQDATWKKSKHFTLSKLPYPILASGLLFFFLVDFGLRLRGQPGLQLLDLHLSPYKSLSYVLQYPDAEIIYRRWNAFSRVDLVRSSAIRSLPGLSYRFLHPIPAADALLVDGDELSPVLKPGTDLGFTAYLPAAIALSLRPKADTLVLEPRGGLDVLTALALGADHLTAVEVNPLILTAAYPVYSDRRVQVILESDRSYIRRTQEQFDLIILSMASSYHPVRSGAYSLAEDYRYTVQSFQDILARLNPDGLLLVTRWLQTPPSEYLRAFALSVTALERSGAHPQEQIAAFRGYNTGTLLVKKSPFDSDELQKIREFCSSRAFDLVYLPDLRPEETNRYNILPEEDYYQAFKTLLESQQREIFYAAYPFDVYPPTDDRPFFNHFFKWSQARQVFAELGKTWQPFGGAGYFVILALLVLASLLAGALIVLPVAIIRLKALYSEEKQHPRITITRSHMASLVYFGLIGFGFLLVEIPLIQHITLYLGQPAYALTGVLFVLLFFSGIGSRISGRIRYREALALLVLILFCAPLLLPIFFRLTLGLSFATRLVLTAAVLAPIGLLMGIPFPAGIHRLLGGGERSPLIPWAWAINGAASVVSAVLAALLALSFGFGWVLRVGALCYAGAYLTLMVAQRWGFVSRLPR